MKKNIKKVIISILTIIFLSVNFQICYSLSFSSPEESIEYILFGEHQFFAKQEEKESLEKLKDASYLCLSQSNNNGKEKFDYLKQSKIKNFPKNLLQINLQAIDCPKKDTHLGWEYKYNNKQWKERKNILLNTCNNVFDFGILSNSLTGFNEKCNSFSALLYYIHIIDDYENMEEDNVDTITIIPLSSVSDEKNLFSEINKYCDILFEEQKDSAEYKEFINYFNFLKLQAYIIDPYNDYKEFQINIQNLSNLMSCYIPRLLVKENFFSNTFPSFKPSIKIYEQQEYRKELKDDNGNIYRIDNSIKKNATIVIDGISYITNENADTIRVEGELKKQTDGRNNITDKIEVIGRGDQLEGDDRGHILGDILGGSNGLENAFPQNYHINRGLYSQFEKELKEYVDNGKKVSVKIELDYEKNNHRPTGVSYTYIIDGEVSNRYFKNRANE